MICFNKNINFQLKKTAIGQLHSDNHWSEKDNDPFLIDYSELFDDSPESNV